MLRLRAGGLTIAEIADRVFLSAGGVTRRLQRAMEMLDVGWGDPKGRIHRACYLLGRSDASTAARPG